MPCAPRRKRSRVSCSSDAGVTTTILHMRRLAQKFRHRFNRIRRQGGFKNQNVRGKFCDGRLGLRKGFGLTDNADIVFEREDLAQAGAKDSLSISQDHTDQAGRCRHPREPRDFLPTLTVVAISFLLSYVLSKWYSSITTPTPRRPLSSKLRTTRPWQSICTSRTRAHNIARKQDGEVHERTHGDVVDPWRRERRWLRCFESPPSTRRLSISTRQVNAAENEEHSAFQRSAWSQSAAAVPPSIVALSLRLTLSRRTFLPDRKNDRPDFQQILSVKFLDELKGSVHPRISPQSYGSHGTIGR